MSLDRRTLLTTSAAAGLLATDRTSFAQAQPQRASVPSREPSASDTVRVDRLDGSILLIGIDRPGAHNTIDPPTFLGLGRAYYLLDHDESLRVGVLYAKGADFVTGLDGAAWESALRGGRFNPGTQEFVEPLGTVPPRREKPLVVAVHGKTRTIGHELFLAADVRVAASDAVFSQEEVTRGHFPAGGATIRFVGEAGWANAMRYMLTGDEWGAEDAYRLGLVQYVTPPGQQLDQAIEVARKIAAAAPLGIKATVRSARRALSDGQEPAFAALFSELGQLAQSEDHQEFFRALQEGRQPAFRGR